MTNRPMYSSAIHSALEIPSPLESAESVKAIVAQELQMFDQSAEVRATDYFNHSFAPDFLLKWRDGSERSVFIRLTDDIECLAEDLQIVAAEQPLVLDLAKRYGEVDFAPVRAATSQTGALISQPDALERLIAEPGKSETRNLASNALGQGGRGVFVGDDVVDFAHAVDAGLTAAAAIDADKTAKALAVVADALHPAQLSRLTRVMQAVWEGADGALTAFPGQVDVSGPLNLDALRYLITYMETEDRNFWRNVGRRLTVAQLSALEIPLPNTNLSRLIEANLDVVQAHACVVAAKQPTLTALADHADHAEISWSFKDGQLAIESASFYALASENKSQLEPVIRRGLSLPSIEEFLRRANEAALESVTLSAGSEELQLRNTESPIDGARLREVSGRHASSARVRSARIESPSGRVTVDLDAGTGTRQTNSNVLLADLLRVTIPITTDLPEAEATALNEFLAYERHSPDPSSIPLIEYESLFDDGET